MRLPDLWDLLEYWEQHPSEHDLLRLLTTAFTTWQPKRPPLAPAEMNGEDRAMLFAAFRCAQQTMPEWIKDAIRRAEEQKLKMGIA